MRRTVPLLLTTALTACALNMGGPRDISVPTVALRTTADVATAAAAIGDARVAFVASTADPAWFRDLAGATNKTLSGPAALGDGVNVAFLAPEPVGDTTLRLTYEGGSFVVHDALYAMAKEDRYLDLLAFRVERPDQARPVIAALLKYVATDVMPASAVAMAVVVPDAATGDSVARMLSPAYFDALRCEAGGQSPERTTGGIRLFHGPEARVYCRDAESVADAGGRVVRASLVMGRR